MADKIVKNKELWDEFRQELQKRQVVTSLATKEVLLEFVQTRTKDKEEPTNSMGNHANDSKLNLFTNEINDQDNKRTEHKPFMTNIFHKNIHLPEKINPFLTPVNETQTQLKSLPLFDSMDIKLGNKLGNGSQSVVYEVKSFPSTHSDSLLNKQNGEWTQKYDHGRSSNHMHHNSQWKQQLPEHLAVKLPRHDVKNYKESIEELLNESNILSSVDHPNIIKIHGVSSKETSQSGSNQSLKPFFLILDRLSYNLEDLLKVWASKKNNINIVNNQTFKEESFQQRIQVAHDIATAMKHLHKKNIMHRDLKPENIGFNSQGTLKLFDFGYATKLLPKHRLSDGTYRLKGGIGTCRYMAPEVAKYENYNELADVYSFGILMWEIITLEKPYSKLKCNEWLKKVVFEGKRPHMDESWKTKLQTLLNCCWSEDINERPSFDIILDVLDEI